MPPNRGKASKSKAPPIDFASVESAARSSTYDSTSQWMEEGVRQEGQGQRYQFGPKAARHYTNSIISYRVASSLDPTSFEAVFNASRVTALLATDHLPPSEACRAFEECITSYKQCLVMAGASVEWGIETGFNLAQAIVSLGGMIQEGAAPEVEAQVGIDMGWEARVYFKEVQTLERVEMDKWLGTAVEGAGMSVEGDEVNAVTPLMVVDTILESVSNDLDLYSNSIPASSSSLHGADLPASIIESCLAAITLSQGTPDSTDLPLELAMTLLSVLDTLQSAPLPHWIKSYAELYPSHSSDPDFLSTWADDLMERGDPRTALVHYERAHVLLSDRFSPPKDIPAYSIPTLLAANLVARSHVHLLLHHQSPDAALLDAGLRLAMDALKISGFGYEVTIAARSQLVITKLPGEPRRDWKTVKVYRSAVGELLRLRRRQGITGDVGAGVVDRMWKEATGRDWERDDWWFMSEIQSDSCWSAEEETQWVERCRNA